MTHQWTRILDGIHHTNYQDSYFQDAHTDGDNSIIRRQIRPQFKFFVNQQFGLKRQIYQLDFSAPRMYPALLCL